MKKKENEREMAGPLKVADVEGVYSVATSLSLSLSLFL